MHAPCILVSLPHNLYVWRPALLSHAAAGERNLLRLSVVVTLAILTSEYFLTQAA